MQTIQSIIGYVKSKAVSLILFALAVIVYNALPEKMPFVELAYTAVTVMGIVVMGPIIRLIVFNEAALYAESGELAEDLKEYRFIPAMVHYWIATVLSYVAPILCVMTMAK